VGRGLLYRSMLSCIQPRDSPSCYEVVLGANALSEGQVCLAGASDVDSVWANYNPATDDYDVRTAPLLPAPEAPEEQLLKQMSALQIRISRGGHAEVLEHYRHVVSDLQQQLRKLPRVSSHSSQLSTSDESGSSDSSDSESDSESASESQESQLPCESEKLLFYDGLFESEGYFDSQATKVQLLMHRHLEDHIMTSHV